MRHRIGLLCFAFLLTASIARGDGEPAPEPHLLTGSAGGLNFAIESAEVKMPGGYSDSSEVVVLVGCTDGQPNCTLARSRGLIGMRVLAVDDQDLLPDNDMVRQIIDAFEQTTTPTVIFDLYSPASNAKPIEVSFARH